MQRTTAGLQLNRYTAATMKGNAFNWTDMRYFLAVAREGTLNAAARQLRVDPTTVRRRISALEAELDVKLIVHRREGWVLTPTGHRARTAAERAETAAVAFSRIATSPEAPSGRVRIATIEIFATLLFAPLLPAFQLEYPDIRLDILCSNDVLDLHRGEADISLRLLRPSEPELIARKLNRTVLRPYVSRAWLDVRGQRPEDIQDLNGAEVLTPLADKERRWSEGLGTVRVVLRTDSYSTLHAATLAGAGVGLLADIVAAPDPELIPLPALGVQIERPLWLVMPADLKDVPRVRAVADFLIGHFAS